MGKNTSISLGNYFEDVNEALEVGEQSGFIYDFDPEEHLKNLQSSGH